MNDIFTFEVFLRQSAKDKPMVGSFVARLLKVGMHPWLAEKQIK
jgi:hypothetical protein